eukprot:4929658-Karenia_brevis.AAC.1
MPNGELLVRHNLNMPEYKMPEEWRVRFRKCDMMPTAVLNPTAYDAQFPFLWDVSRSIGSFTRT